MVPALGGGAKVAASFHAVERRGDSPAGCEAAGFEVTEVLVELLLLLHDAATPPNSRTAKRADAVRSRTAVGRRLGRDTMPRR